MGDDEPCKIIGMGKVQIKLNNGNEWFIKHVRHIPAMKINVISTWQLGDSNCLLRLEKLGGRSLREHWY